MSGDGRQGVFEIGLTMAGAISGGAYAAGVVDFLFQALSEWEKAKIERPDDPGIPRHDVRLRVLSGASAGGMTAAVLAASLQDGFDPVTGLADGRSAPANNKLYHCWVEKIDIRHLLTDRDLKMDKSVKSILDSTILDDIAVYGFGSGGGVHSGAAWPRYVSDPLEIFLTVANLRGVPYTVRFQGTTGQAGHELVRHQDHVRFLMGNASPAAPPGDGFFLDGGGRSGDAWKLFSTAALATGAFPVGLAPRVLSKPKSFYDKKWDIPGCAEQDGGGARQVTFRSRTVPPDWTSGGCPDSGGNLDFLAVDGGLMNNEPFELARKALAGSDACNPRGLGQASRAVIMIDPFPDPGWCKKGKDQGKGDVVTFARLMFGALTAQARFKPEEIALALDEDVYSRFLISPSKENRSGAGSDMAAASLGGFGGFLSRNFRLFDFQLGRRDCQNFLRDHFALPLEGKTGEQAADGNIFMRQSSSLVQGNPVFQNSVNFNTFSYTDSDGKKVLPIIPLCGEAFPEVPLIPRASIRMTEDELKELRLPIIKRLAAVAGALSGRMESRLSRGLVRAAMWFKKQDFADSILDAVKEDLKEHELY